MSSRFRSDIPAFVLVSHLNQRNEGLVRGNTKTGVVRGVLPGEVLTMHRYTSKRRTRIAKLGSLIHTPWKKIKPFCQHYHSCGGCQLQELSYQQQCELKKKIVLQCLDSVEIKLPTTISIIPAPTHYYYRNKMEYSFSPRVWKDAKPDPGAYNDNQIQKTQNIHSTTLQTEEGGLGLFVPRFYDKVTHIDECFLQDSSFVRNDIHRWAILQGFSRFDPRTREGLLRSIIIRTSLLHQNMYILVASEWNTRLAREFSSLAETWEKSDKIRVKDKQVTQAHMTQSPKADSLYYATVPAQKTSLTDAQLHHLSGAQHIAESNSGKTLYIGPQSFYQTNSRGAELLYATISRHSVALCKKTKIKTIVDLFCGIGGIGIHLSSLCSELIGVDIDQSAIELARENARINAVAHAHFICMAVEMLSGEWYSDYDSSHSLVIIDPPRAGLHPKTCKSLLVFKPQCLVYVSCNPYSLADDLVKLCSVYHIESIELIDLFPHTRHVETVVALSIKQ